MSVNPQIVDAINNSEKNTFHIVPALSQTGQMIGENITRTVIQVSGNSYWTLPTTAAVGSIIQVTGVGSGLFTIAQNAGQQIRLGGFKTTTGPLGSLASTSCGDAVELICTLANTNFQVLEAIGNLTIS